MIWGLIRSKWGPHSVWPPKRVCWTLATATKRLPWFARSERDRRSARLLGSGAVIVGRVYGVERVPAVKGQSISAYDPRAIKGTGVTYATSPQGADHTCGLTIRAKIDHLDPAIQTDVSRTAQLNNAGYDTLGACIFAGFGFAASPESIRDLLNARYGWDVSENIRQELGYQTIRLEKEFNRRAGFTKEHE